MRIDDTFIVALLIALAIGLVINIFFLLTLQNTLKACRPQNRLLPPGQVWLQLIPLFNLVWPFIMNPKVSDSVKKELESRGHREQGDYGRTIGILYPAFNFGTWIPFLGGLLSLAILVLWIMYWVKMSGYKNKIEMLPVDDSGSINYSGQTDILDTI